MKPRPLKEAKNDDLFRSRLTQIINTRHELAQLADKIDWAHIDQQVQPFFATEGRPAIPSRFMIGLHILKSMYYRMKLFANAGLKIRIINIFAAKNFFSINSPFSDPL